MPAISAEYKGFIAEQLAALKSYDAKRPAGHPYAFHEHSERVASSMRALALAMNMDKARAETLYYAALIHDIGKRLLPVEIWDVDGKPDNKIKNQRRAHTTLGVKIIDDNFGDDNHEPFLDLVRDLMQNHHEQIDGSGWQGKKYNDLSMEARMLCICDAFDGYSVARPHYGKRDISPEGVILRMTTGDKAGHYDPVIMAKFIGIKAGNRPDAVPPRRTDAFAPGK